MLNLNLKLHVILADLLCNFEENETPNPQKKSLSIMKSICNSRNSSLNSSLNSSFQGNKGEEFIFS